jgi:hypothetical protein
MKTPLLLTALLALLGGCTWVKLDDAGARVRVAYDGRVDGCDKAGDVSVTVKSKVGVYERNDLKVKDELETLARNEAVSLPADTIVANGEPRNGAQSFTAYRCGARTASPRRSAQEAQPNRDAGEAQTFPVR